MRYVVTALPLSLVATAGFVVTPNIVSFSVALLGTVGTVVAVLTWLDKTIEKKIVTHEETARLEVALFRQEILGKIEELHKLLMTEREDVGGQNKAS